MMSIIRRYIPKWVRRLVVNVTMIVVFVGIIIGMFKFNYHQSMARTRERCDYLGGELVRVETLHKNYITCSARKVTAVEE